MLFDLLGGSGICGCDRLERRVACGSRCGVAAELARKIVGPDEVDDSKRGFRQRPRLVEAHEVDGRQRLDRVQLLRERAAARHPHRRDGVRQAREQDQSLRHHRHDRGDGGRHRGVQRRVPVPERVAEQRAERHHHGDEREQQPVQRALERRARMPERSCLARDPRGVALLTDGGDAVRAEAFDDERA